MKQQLVESQSKLDTLLKFKDEKHTDFAKIKYPSGKDLYNIQEYMWDEYPIIEYYRGRVEGFKHILNGDKPEKSLIDYALKYGPSDPYPGFLHGYYSALVESGDALQDESAKKIADAFEKSKRYSQIVTRPNLSNG